MNVPISQTMHEHLKSIPTGNALYRTYCNETTSWKEEVFNTDISKSNKLLVQQYELFPGIDVTYNYFLSEGFYHKHPHMPTIMVINHCRHGRIGWQMENNLNLYLGEGDLSIHMKDSCSKSHLSFPLGFYEGISFSINFHKLVQDTPNVLKDANLDFEKLQETFCDNTKTTALPASRHIEHIFSELYDLPENLVTPYCKLKSQELILFLSQFSLKKTPLLNSCDSEQVKLIEEIHSLLTANLNKRYTIEYLSKQYLLNTSTLKAAFKAVYGLPIATYTKQYRMNQAASLLRDTNHTIAEIAATVGYENQSKFTTAFKNVIGVLPTTYRKENFK